MSTYLKFWDRKHCGNLKNFYHCVRVIKRFSKEHPFSSCSFQPTEKLRKKQPQPNVSLINSPQSFSARIANTAKAFDVTVSLAKSRRKALSYFCCAHLQQICWLKNASLSSVSLKASAGSDGEIKRELGWKICVNSSTTSGMFLL
jgi:hypothetical protein